MTVMTDLWKNCFDLGVLINLTIFTYKVFHESSTASINSYSVINSVMQSSSLTTVTSKLQVLNSYIGLTNTRN